jgi:hypothetical protein
MTLQVSGPRAQRFVDLLSDYSGLTLTLSGGDVAFSKDGLIDPFVSETLQTLVNDILASPNVVEVHAFGGNPSPATGFFGDSFRGSVAFQRPRRSVFVDDILNVEKLSPTMAKALIGHILREYFGAARPPGRAPGTAFAVYHVPAILTEAHVAGDLENRPVFTGNVRPWEATYGHINVREYGPTMKYQLFFSAGGYLTGIKGP